MSFGGKTFGRQTFGQHSLIETGQPMEEQALKIVNICWNTNIHSYLETSGGQSSNLYLNVVHLSNTGVN